MLSSSPSKIHEPRVTGVSPRPTTSDSARKLRNTRRPVGARNAAHVMRPADIRGAARRSQSRRRTPAASTDLVDEDVHLVSFETTH
jgi:hypothetical protein